MNDYVPVNMAYDLYESSKGIDPTLSPVIFLHGHSSDRKTWRCVLPPIAEKTKRKLYAPDFRNYGDSDYTDGFGLTSCIEDLFHFMDTRLILKAILVGHSWGALVGSNAALKRPERVEMYISEDTFVRQLTDEECLDAGDYVMSLSNMFEKIPSQLNEEEAIRHVVDQMFDELSEENKKWTPKEVLYRVRTPLRRTPDGRYYSGCNTEVIYRIAQEKSPMIMEPVGTFEGPAVFFYGTVSRVNMVSQMTQIKKHFPKAEFIRFEGGSHSLHSQFEEKFIETLTHVLNSYR